MNDVQSAQASPSQSCTDTKREITATIRSSEHRVPGVLVVDDEPAVRRLLEVALLRHGFIVWLAESGEQAVQLFAKHQPDIRLVLLDIRMPGLDGPQTLASIRVLSPNVPCCFMSGETGGYSPDVLTQLGAVQVIDKPFKLDEIVKLVEHLTGFSRTT